MSSSLFQSFNTVTAIRITLPLMLTALSSNLMVFLGRFVLAKYDMNAMNAVASTILVSNAFQIAGLSITTIAEIFVGQYNGAQQYIGVPNAVWQMIFFSLILIGLFLPLSFIGGQYLIPAQFQILGIPYFRITMTFGFLVPMLGALASFFVGTGQTKPLIISSIIANSINIVLSVILVFGYQNFIPVMGANGAAYATGIALLVQVLFLFIVFINPQNHQKFRTRQLKIDIIQMLACFKLGTPNALSRMIEIAGWVIVVSYLSTVGNDYITVQTICHSLVIMFMFSIEGLSKGVTAMVSNAIGQNAMNEIVKIVRSAVSVLMMILGILWGILWYAPEFTILKLMNHAQFINPGLIWQVRLALKGLWIYFLFNGLSLVIWGVLIAGGDTKFIMWINAITTWAFAVIPTYIWVAYFPSTAAVPFQYIAPMYSFLSFIIVARRFYHRKWLKFNINQSLQQA